MFCSYSEKVFAELNQYTNQFNLVQVKIALKLTRKQRSVEYIFKSEHDD